MDDQVTKLTYHEHGRRKCHTLLWNSKVCNYVGLSVKLHKYRIQRSCILVYSGAFLQCQVQKTPRSTQESKRTSPAPSSMKDQPLVDMTWERPGNASIIQSWLGVDELLMFSMVKNSMVHWVHCGTIVEGSLEVKFQIRQYGQMEKQRWEEPDKRREEKRREEQSRAEQRRGEERREEKRRGEKIREEKGSEERRCR